jgi:proteasome lid subunit RPN8/RPN11
MTIEVTSAVLEGLIAEARAAHPLECCGLLFGSDAAIRSFRSAANVHAAPATRFEIDPQALIDAHRAMRAGGPRLIGYYHSHPIGPAEPSPTDRASAGGDARVWAIVGEGRVTLWRAERGRMEQLPYRVLPA